MWRSCALAAVTMMAWVHAALPQDPPLAREGRGLLPPTTEFPGALAGSTRQPFARDASGLVSRTLFETDADPTLRVVVRDFSFAPGRGRHSFVLPAGAFIHLISDHGVIAIGTQRFALMNGEMLAVPAGTPIEVVNNGEQHVVVRALIVEVK